jgi:pyruvate,water dikinase
VGSDVIWLGEPGSEDPQLVGGKAAGLARHVGRFRVPTAFCVPPRPEGAFDLMALINAYRELGERSGWGDSLPVAVRSSAVDEDGATSSFAGQYETVLNVVGGQAVAAAVARCLGSAHDERVVEYRRQRGLPENVPVAVLVQELVLADVSAVVFTADPVSGDRSKVVVTASWGLGESVVGGTVTPDTFVVDKAAMSVVEHRIAQKERMTVPATEGTSEVGVPRMLQALPCLEDEAVVAAARMAVDLEIEAGRACDVECAWRGEDLYLLQCRPVTALQ